MRMREADVLAAVGAFVTSQGYEVLEEFPLLGRVADLFGARQQQTMAVECKERDWRRGLKQARTYLAAVDDVYLAIPKRALTDELTNQAGIFGIGVMAVDETEVRVVLDGRRSKEDFPSLHARTLRQFVARRSDNG